MGCLRVLARADSGWDVFVTYARADSGWDVPLVAAVEAAGLKVWRDTDRIDSFDGAPPD